MSKSLPEVLAMRVCDIVHHSCESDRTWEHVRFRANLLLGMFNSRVVTVAEFVDFTRSERAKHFSTPDLAQIKRFFDFCSNEYSVSLHDQTTPTTSMGKETGYVCTSIDEGSRILQGETPLKLTLTDSVGGLTSGSVTVTFKVSEVLKNGLPVWVERGGEKTSATLTFDHDQGLGTLRF